MKKFLAAIALTSLPIANAAELTCTATQVWSYDEMITSPRNYGLGGDRGPKPPTYLETYEVPRFWSLTLDEEKLQMADNFAREHFIFLNNAQYSHSGMWYGFLKYIAKAEKSSFFVPKDGVGENGLFDAFRNGGVGEITINRADLSFWYSLPTRTAYPNEEGKRNWSKDRQNYIHGRGQCWHKSGHLLPFDLSEEADASSDLRS